MIDMSKAIITVDTSEETLAKIERDRRYYNATPEEREKMADEEQKAWEAKYGIESYRQ